LLLAAVVFAACSGSLARPPETTNAPPAGSHEAAPAPPATVGRDADDYGAHPLVRFIAFTGGAAAGFFGTFALLGLL
jgi:hypothetical protein